MPELALKKSPLLSKTLWTNLILGITAMFVPVVNEYVLSNPEAVVLIFSLINMVLRLVTKSKISLS